jgi:hypothetical protein
MAVAVGVYAASVVLLGVAFLVLSDAQWLSSPAVGAAIFACTPAWIAGHMRAAGRLRILAFGSPGTPPAGGDVAGHGASPESPGPTSH